MDRALAEEGLAHVAHDHHARERSMQMDPRAESRQHEGFTCTAQERLMPMAPRLYGRSDGMQDRAVWRQHERSRLQQQLEQRRAERHALQEELQAMRKEHRQLERTLRAGKSSSSLSKKAQLRPSKSIHSSGARRGGGTALPLGAAAGKMENRTPPAQVQSRQPQRPQQQVQRAQSSLQYKRESVAGLAAANAIL